MDNTYFQNKTIKKLLSHYENIWTLTYLAKLAMWDSEVYMPTSGSNYRGLALAKSQAMIKRLILDSSFLELFTKARTEKLNIYEQAVIRVLDREITVYQKLPVEFLEEFEKVTNKAQLVWREARLKNNYAIFEPYLAQIVKLSREKAKLINKQVQFYDTLLDQFEEGSSSSKLDKHFEKVLQVTTTLLDKIKSSKKFNSQNPLSLLSYNKTKAIKLNNNILKFLDYDNKRLRIDVSTHPFSEGLSTNDSRITTRYEEKDFARTLTSTIHEFGHALYFLQHNDSFNTTPLYNSNSLALHESQSRFFENHIGRSKEFINQNLKLFQQLGKEYEQFNVEDYYSYFNYVSPSLIRVEADEITYHLHIYIRYELEKQLIAGEIDTKDVPKYWNALYTKYLGITPPGDNLGCLQDIHWSMGAIGYFPTYSQGTVFAAQIANVLETSEGEIEALLKTNEGIRKLKNWLKTNIHSYGSTYTFEELSKKLTGSSPQIEPWKKYIELKYGKLYKL